jgi:hypothetical protein
MNTITAERPEVRSQGTIIAEWDSVNELYYVMTPEGEVVTRNLPSGVQTFAKQWFKKNLGGGNLIGVGRIEWR